MTPERRAYAQKRVLRLTAKLDKINTLIGIRAHSGHPNDVENRRLLIKDRNSISNAIKRWEKMLAE